MHNLEFNEPQSNQDYTEGAEVDLPDFPITWDTSVDLKCFYFSHNMMRFKMIAQIGFMQNINIVYTIKRVYLRGFTVERQ